MNRRFRQRTYRYNQYPVRRRRTRFVIAACLLIVAVAALLQFFIFGASHPYQPGYTNIPAATGSSGTSGKPFGIALGGTLDSLNSSQLSKELKDIQSLGVEWIRIDVPWPEVQPNNGASYNWSRIDRVVTAAGAHHLKILGMVGYTPGWAAERGCNDSTQKCAPASRSVFAGFVTSAAKRYSHHGIDAWEIWNEPNNQGFWMPAPDPTKYTQLLQESYTALKGVDPSAVVLTGSLGPVDGAPKSVSPVMFLSGMYSAGARSYFDALGYHPYSYPDLPSTNADWSGWSMMDSLSPSIRSVMTANGDTGKQVWITEYGAPTGGPGITTTNLNYGLIRGTNHVSTQLQAQMLSQSVQQYEQFSWLGNYFWYSYKDLGTNTSNPGDFFGLLNHDGSPKPAYSAYKQVIAASK